MHSNTFQLITIGLEALKETISSARTLLVAMRSYGLHVGKNNGTDGGHGGLSKGKEVWYDIAAKHLPACSEHRPC